MKSTIGSKAAPTLRNPPIAIPAGTAMIAASAKAPHTRRIEIPAWRSRCWSQIICQSVAAMTLGGGRNKVLSQPARIESSQSASTAAPAPMAMPAEIRRGSWPRNANSGDGARRRGRLTASTSVGRAAPAPRIPASGSATMSSSLAEIGRGHGGDDRIVDCFLRCEMMVGGTIFEIELHHRLEGPVERSRCARNPQIRLDRRIGRIDETPSDRRVEFLRAQIEMWCRDLQEIGSVRIEIMDRAENGGQEFPVFLGVGPQILLADDDHVGDDAGIVARGREDMRLALAEFRQRLG